MFQSHYRSGLLNILHTQLANAFRKTATKNQARRMHWHMLASFAINILLRTTPTLFYMSFYEQFVRNDYFLVLKQSEMRRFWQQRNSACQIAVQKFICSIPLPIKT